MSLASIIADRMDATATGPAVDDEGDATDLAADSAFSDLADALKTGKSAEGRAALRELLALLKD